MKNKPYEKIYLGDGVYMSDEGFQIRLETHRPFGREENDVIYLDRDMITKLYAFIKSQEVEAGDEE